jgi:hypothetical protein
MIHRNQYIFIQRHTFVFCDRRYSEFYKSLAINYSLRLFATMKKNRWNRSEQSDIFHMPIDEIEISANQIEKKPFSIQNNIISNRKKTFQHTE